MSPATGSDAGGPLLSVEGLTRRFGGLTAVDDLSLHVDPGELVGLIGPNGAGKTTAFNLITGFDRPTSGRVRFAGTDITRWSVHRRARAGMVRTFQGHDVFPAETTRRNVEIAVSAARSGWLGRSRREQVSRRAAELVERVGLARYADQLASGLPHAASGLLGVAMAMASEPRLILLDEPLAGANQTEAAEILAVVEALRRDGTAVVLVEHNMQAVMANCQRVIVLHHGKRLAEGTPETVRADEQVVSAYLGEEHDVDVA